MLTSYLQQLTLALVGNVHREPAMGWVWMCVGEAFGVLEVPGRPAGGDLKAIQWPVG